MGQSLTRADDRIPFVVAASGHRDLVKEDVRLISRRLERFFVLLALTLPNTPLRLLCPLAEGLDQLAAAAFLRAARRLEGRVPRLQLFVPMPMPEPQYLARFCELVNDPVERERARAAAIRRFHRLKARARCCFTIAPDHASGDELYLVLARYLNLRSQILIAVWDGYETVDGRSLRATGGTLDAVLRRLEGVERETPPGSTRRFVEPDRGDVIHVYARRRKAYPGVPSPEPRCSGTVRLLEPAGGARRYREVDPEEIPAAGSARESQRVFGSWLTRPLETLVGYAAQTRPWHRTRARVHRDFATLGRKPLAVAPIETAVVFKAWTLGREIDQLNATHLARLRDARYAKGLRASRQSLIASLGRPGPDALERAEPLVASYVISDALAVEAKRSWKWRWECLIWLIVLLSASSALKVLPSGACLELAALLVGSFGVVALYLMVSASANKNAFVDYRALAEGLRFQLYWYLAGLRLLVTSHYVNHLRSELGWLRRAIDGVCVCPPLPYEHRVRPNDLAKAWIRTQLCYSRAARKGLARSEIELRIRADRLMATGLALLLASAALAFGEYARPHMFGEYVMAAAKLFLALGAGAVALGTRLGLSDQERQQRHLTDVYHRAAIQRRKIVLDPKLNEAGKDTMLLELIEALGKAALGENANWLRAHRKQPQWHGR